MGQGHPAAEDSRQAHEVRRFFSDLAAEVGDRARVALERLSPDAERVELIPRAPGALAVVVEYDPQVEGAGLWITVAEHSQEGDVDWLRLLVPAVVAGNVTVWEGSGRRRLDFHVYPGDVRHETLYLGRRGCLPAPGWTRRARSTQAAPYT